MQQRIKQEIWMPTPEEDARITAAAEADPDTWIPTDDEYARMRPMSEVHPDIVAAYNNGGIKITTETLATVVDPRVEVTLKLDKGLLIYYRQTGEGWEQRLNDALRSVAFAGCDPRVRAGTSANGCTCSGSNPVYVVST